MVVFVLPAGAAPAESPLARTILIGHSARGRPIRAVEVGDPSKPATLVVGCIHGNECAGIAIVRRLRASAPRGVHLWLVATLNPDGLAANTRQNGHGVDLNRNWPVDWRGGGRPWDTYYPGPRPLSEPETRAGLAFLLRVKPSVSVWYHQHLAIVWGSASHLVLERRYSRLTGLPLHHLPAPSGAATRWERRQFPGATAFVVELPAGRLSPAAVRRHAAAVLAISH
jgi:murein peptide amidase A